MKAALTAWEGNAGRLHGVGEHIAQMTADVEADKPLRGIAVKPTRMVRQSNDKVWGQMHAARLIVLGLGQINVLAFQIDLREVDRQSFRKPHTGVAEKAQKQ